MNETERKMAAEILRLEDSRVTGPDSLRVTRLPAEDRGGRWEICGICDGIEPAKYKSIKDRLDRGDREGAWEECLQYVLDHTSRIRSWLGTPRWPGVEFFCRDFCFNAGSGAVAKMLQRALSAHGYPLADDGIVGPATRRALADCLEKVAEATFLDTLQEKREAFYRSCRQFKVFGKGWLSRTEAAARFARLLT